VLVSTFGKAVVTRPQSALATRLTLNGPCKGGRNGFPAGRDKLYTRALAVIVKGKLFDNQ